MASISLSGLFDSVFGASPFEPVFSGVKGDGGPLSDRTEAGSYGTNYYRIDEKGREYYLPISMEYPKQIELPDGTFTSGVNVKVDLWYPVVNVTAEKRIITTEMTEQPPVMEFINNGAYKFLIQGFIVNHVADELPEEYLKQLRALYENKTPVIMRCAETDIYMAGFEYQVVISSVRVPAVKGVKNVRGFELECMSNAPFNLLDIS